MKKLEHRDMGLMNRAYSPEMAEIGLDLLVKRLDAQIQAEKWERVSETRTHTEGPTVDLVTGETYWQIAVSARVKVEVEDEK